VQAPRQEKVEGVETELQVFFTLTPDEGGFQIRAVWSQEPLWVRQQKRAVYSCR